MTQKQNSLPILTYHSLDSSGSVISTSPEKFRQQMKDLANSSVKVVGLSDVAGCIREKRSFPSNAVAITFDDGFKNFYDIGFRVLQEHGFPATVFVVTDYCGKNNQWYGQWKGIPAFELLTWDQISEMAKSNMEFGAHSATHPDLTELSEDKISEEVLGSRDALRKHLGTQDIAFAYPYGKKSPIAQEVVSSNFYAGCSTQMEFVMEDSDLYFLPRIDMYYFSNNDRFSSIGKSSFKRFVHFRKALRDLRQIFSRDQDTTEENVSRAGKVELSNQVVDN